MDIQAYLGLNQKIICAVHKHTLAFIKPAKTSRNTLVHHDVAYLTLHDDQGFGVGEYAPIRGLSLDHIDILPQLVHEWNNSSDQWNWSFWRQRSSAFVFALETALLHYKGFLQHPIQSIPINGLVWMNDLDLMYAEALQKIEAGFNCIKLKVGAHHFQDELALLQRLRQQFSPDQITLRLDANGAFNPQTALAQLHELAAFHIHSMEQPIRAGQWDAMAQLCSQSPIPIALDEELIGIYTTNEKQKLLQTIQPQFIILKPTLHGGLQCADEWVKLANERGIGWWATSALESNIGLHAIAQWLQHKSYRGHQGLGTGALYSNNIPAPLKVDHGFLMWDNEQAWDFEFLH